MPKINSTVETTYQPNSIGLVLNNPNNIFNQALSALPNQQVPPTDVIEETDIVQSTDVTLPPASDITDALDYEVWAASWTTPSNIATSIVPMIFVNGSFGGTGTTNTTDDLVSTEQFNEFKTSLLSIPETRRLVQLKFWANVPWNYSWDDIGKLNYTLENDGIQIDSNKLLFTPWFESTIMDAKNSVEDFLSRCQAENLSFNYLVNVSNFSVGEAPTIWTIGTSQRIGNCPNSNDGSDEATKCVCGLRHYTCTDWANPDMLEAITSDIRFNTVVNDVNGKTLQNDFYDRYTTIMNQTSSLPNDSFYYLAFGTTSWYTPSEPTALEALTPLFGYTENTLPWNNASKNAAVRAWNATIYDWGNLHYRLGLFNSALNNYGYSEIKISEFNQYPMSSEEIFYTEDGSTWQEAPRDDHSRFLISPAFFGQIADPNLFAYKLNPVTDNEKYAFVKIPTSLSTPIDHKRIDTPSWLSFLLDIRKARAILRSNPLNWERFKPWIISPTFQPTTEYRYSSDSQYGLQYWKELIFHLCLNGTKTFQYLNENSNSTEILHEVLENWRLTSLNSYSEPVNLDRIQISSNTVISGGRMSKTGKYLWRITARPSTGNVLKTYGDSTTRTDIPQEITIPENSRGVWLETTSNIPPLYI